MDYQSLYAFTLATAALAISPGPDNMYVLAQSLAHGKKHGLATVAGHISGCLVHTSLLAFGVSAIIRESDSLFLAITILGAVYLLYLAFKVYRSDSQLQISKGNKRGKDVKDETGKTGGADGEHESGKAGEPDAKDLWQLFRQGLIMNVLNPKVAIFFLAFFPGFLFSETLDTTFQLYVLGLLFMAVSGIIFSGIALLSGTISQYVASNKNIGPGLKWLQITVFVGIAAYLLLSDK